LLTRLKTNEFGSLKYLTFEAQGRSVNAPKMLPLVDFITVKVFEIPSHLE
jgi:hypothetical protein